MFSDLSALICNTLHRDPEKESEPEDNRPAAAFAENRNH